MSTRNAYWYAATGQSQMDYIEKDGKLYVSIDTAASLVMQFRMKLMRMGILKFSGLDPIGIVELFQILAAKMKHLEYVKTKPQPQLELPPHLKPLPPPSKV